MSTAPEPATRLFWLPEIRDPSAPTAEELAQGVEFTGHIVPGSVAFAFAFDDEPEPFAPLVLAHRSMTLTLRGRTHITRGWLLTLDHAFGGHLDRRYRACPVCNPRRDRPVGPPPASHTHGYHAKTRHRRNRR